MNSFNATPYISVDGNDILLISLTGSVVYKSCTTFFGPPSGSWRSLNFGRKINRRLIDSSEAVFVGRPPEPCQWPVLGMIEQPAVVCSSEWRPLNPSRHRHCLSRDQSVKAYQRSLAATNVGNGSRLCMISKSRGPVVNTIRIAIYT